jgi:hypothetical protein
MRRILKFPEQSRRISLYRQSVKLQFKREQREKLLELVFTKTGKNFDFYFKSFLDDLLTNVNPEIRPDPIGRKK